MRRSIYTLLLLLIVTSVVGAENWPHWRGPHYNGFTSEKNLPVKWSTTENIRWTADLPGPSASTPIIWKDHVFISSTVPASDGLAALCFDRTSGKLLWRRAVSKGIRQDTRSTFAAPSPVTDGRRVVYFYGNGTMVCFDFSGQQQWRHDIEREYGQFAFNWTFSSTPLLHNGKLYLQVLQRDVPVNGRGLTDRKNESYLLALDPATGKELWRHIRPSKAFAESREAFTSPIPFEYRERRELLVVGGDALTGHDPETGKELWRWGTWNPSRIGHWRLVPSPVASEDVILACAPKRSPIYAIKAGGSGQLGDDSIAWISDDVREVSADVPTPAYYQGDFFVLSDVRRCLSRVEPRTGQVKWTVPTPGIRKYEASPLAADGKIYLLNFDATAVVMSADDGKVLHTIDMAEPSESPIRSSISASQGNLFLRTNTKLFCIGPQ